MYHSIILLSVTSVLYYGGASDTDYQFLEHGCWAYFRQHLRLYGGVPTPGRDKHHRIGKHELQKLLRISPLGTEDGGAIVQIPGR